MSKKLPISSEPFGHFRPSSHGAKAGQDDPEQSRRFIKMAEELEAHDDTLKAAVKKVAVHGRRAAKPKRKKAS